VLAWFRLWVFCGDRVVPPLQRNERRIAPVQLLDFMVLNEQKLLAGFAYK